MDWNVQEFQEIKESIVKRLNQLDDVTDENVLELLEAFIFQNFFDLPLIEKDRLIKMLFNSIRRLGKIQDLIDDDQITEIMINGYKEIRYEKSGRIYLSDIQFQTKDELDQIIQKIVGSMDRKVNEKYPICDVRLQDGSRVNIVLTPIGIDGPYVTIRKFPKKKMIKSDLIRNKTISEEAMTFLEMLVLKKYNIFISGGTSSGKTTLLNVLSDFIQCDERVITIEDSAELKISNVANLVRLETRMGDDEYTHHIPIKNLIKTALRMRPDRIIVGEVRGEETIDMLQAMNTGHDGSISTGHGNSIKEMLFRLETMVLTAMDIPLAAIRQQIASAIDILIHIQKIGNKGRRVTEIAEIIGVENNHIIVRSLYCFDDEMDQLVKTEYWLENQQKLNWN